MPSNKKLFPLDFFQFLNIHPSSTSTSKWQENWGKKNLWVIDFFTPSQAGESKKAPNNKNSLIITLTIIFARGTPSISELCASRFSRLERNSPRHSTTIRFAVLLIRSRLLELSDWYFKIFLYELQVVLKSSINLYGDELLLLLLLEIICDTALHHDNMSQSQLRAISRRFLGARKLRHHNSINS